MSATPIFLSKSDSGETGEAEVPPASARCVRVVHYCGWASGLQPVDEFVAAQTEAGLRARVAKPDDPALLAMARLDRDWHVENARVFAAMQHPAIEFRDAHVVGAKGLQDLTRLTPAPDEEWWLILMAQHPQHFARVAGALLGFLRKRGVRILYYAYDEASRTMPCFRDLAPHLDVLIHDESPLAHEGAAALRPECLRIHRSWVANVEPFATAFEDAPEERIVFLGSQMGVTPHRRRQIDFLKKRFGERFVAIHDHSVQVGERHLLAKRFKVSVCPEGRKFGTPAMQATHTDRPFWSGCLGMVPVSENSVRGDRLESLHRDGLIVRYGHGDLEELAAACERALAMQLEERRRIYEYFNRHETVGTVVADAIAGALRAPV